LALGYLAVENWTFGFERIVELRLKPVTATNHELLRAEANRSELTDQRKQLMDNRGQKRNELRTGIDQRNGKIAELTAQLSREGEIHQRNLQEIREACRLIRDKCMLMRSKAEDDRYAAEIKRLSDELAKQRTESSQLQSQIDTLVQMDSSDGAELDRKIAVATTAATEAREAFQKAVDGNQIYRLAASWYGVNTINVTAEQFAKARWVFSNFSAIAVAFAASIAALVYYARNRVPGEPSVFSRLMGKVAHARRAYYARKCKPLKIAVPGPEQVIYCDGKEPPVVVEKEVVRLVDNIVLIPRWGIRVPVYINSLIRRGAQASQVHSRSDEVDESLSNVMPLKKAH
jgi:hypothetical protein